MADVIRIDGVYYDTKKLAAVHPGGELFVLISNNQDSTALFNSSHRRAFPHKKYESFKVAETAEMKAKLGPAPTQSFNLYFEICEKVKPIIVNNGFAPAYYYVKVALLIAAWVALDVYMTIHGRTMGLTTCLGIVSAWIGLNVQHDANHGAVSRNPTINRLFGLSQDLIGGSALGWMISHDTIHHVHCNDIDRDHDLAIPLLRLHTKVPWQVMYTVQQLYVWGLEALFGVVHVLYNAVTTVQGPTKDQKVLAEYFSTHRMMLAFTVSRWVMNFYLNPSLHTVIHLALVYALGGLYLAFFFIISHNFDGVRKEGIDSHTDCFVRNQVETSSNVGGWLLAQLNGGLNYQIEHHLFPRVHHSQYHYIAPIVRAVCKKHGIQYTHFPLLWDNVTSTFNHLYKLGVKTA